MITLVSSPKQHLHINMQYSVKENIAISIFFSLFAGEEVIEAEAVPDQDHVTVEMVSEAENLRLTKKNYWPLLRKMQLGCLVPTI